MFLCFCTNAQTNLLMEAQDLSNSKQFDKAMPLLDQVILHPETKDDPASWHIRSYVYLQLFKQAGNTISNTQKVNLLDISVKSAEQSMALDKDGAYKENNYGFIKSSAAGYYKLCISYLDSLNAPRSEECYNKYKRNMVIFSPTFDFKEKDIEYYKATGSLFSDMYIKNNFSQKYGDVAKAALLKVLDLDPKNIVANINLGILYYNQGATLMRMSDYDMDLAQLDVVQENAKKIFKQSLPFMIKVYELDPQNKKALEGLQGIYSALMDEEKANEFKLKKEALIEQK
jgi:tetratricopeptide (TPR) repeat protein